MWTNHGSYYEYNVKQMSDEWMKARKFRITTSKWNLISDVEKLIVDVCGNPIIQVDSLSTDIQEIINNEDRVRQDYISLKSSDISDIRTPGLIIPNPNSKLYNFVPKEDKYLLLHLGCSPDLIGNDRKSKRQVAIELKQPLNGKIYPDVLKFKQVRKHHRNQVNGSGGIINSIYNEYFVWTEDNGHICIKSYTSRKLFQDKILKLIQIIKEYIITHPDSSEIVLPPQLKSYYEKKGI